MLRFPCPKCGEVFTASLETVEPLCCTNCGRVFRPSPETPGGGITWRLVMCVLISMFFYLVVNLAQRAAVDQSQLPHDSAMTSLAHDQEPYESVPPSAIGNNSHP
jgi:hypothetical protein